MSITSESLSLIFLCELRWCFWFLEATHATFVWPLHSRGQNHQRCQRKTRHPAKVLMTPLAANSAQCVHAGCLHWLLRTTLNREGFLWGGSVCVCVFLGVNVLTRLSDLINTCTATAPLVFMLKLFSDTHVYTHTHNSEQCVVQLLMSGPLGTAPDSLPPCQLPAHDPLIHPPPHGPHSWCRAYTM